MGWTYATHSSAAVRSLLAYLCQGGKSAHSTPTHSNSHKYTAEEGAILLFLAQTVNNDLRKHMVKINVGERMPTSHALTCCFTLKTD